ncbi:MAG: ribosome small subunit-dependent GTPase A [Candidatus Eiseniibacteriota bacterium]
MTLETLGWNDRLAGSYEALAAPEREPARVLRADREQYHVQGAGSPLVAQVSGRLRHEARNAAEFPAVGDWVVIEPRPAESAATIHALLPRASAFSRKAAGLKTEEQIVAANVDRVFVVTGLDGDFNPHRIERYLTAVWESGATPVVILNKADLCASVTRVEELIAEVETVSPGVPVLAVSALAAQGLEALEAHLDPGSTVALVGSSGAGKSTLLNALMGSVTQDTGEVRVHDSRGRHTTTHRELFVLPGGALLLDTPGMRELALWGGGEGLESSFPEVEELARECRFSDCRHDGEPGCAVARAIETGTLPEERFASYRKLEREALAFAARHGDRRAQAKRRAMWRSITKAHRNRPPRGYR